jgi:hypothetical protein
MMAKMGAWLEEIKAWHKEKTCEEALEVCLRKKKAKQKTQAGLEKVETMTNVFEEKMD